MESRAIPRPEQCIKDLVLPQVQCKSQLHGFNPWPWELPYAAGAAIKKKKKPTVYDYTYLTISNIILH